MSGKMIKLMLLKECTALQYLNWFEPVQSKIEVLLASIRDESLEGLSSKEISMLKDASKLMREMPYNARRFLSAIGEYREKEQSSMADFRRINSAISSLGWAIISEHNLTSNQHDIIEHIWLEIMGYPCPFQW